MPSHGFVIWAGLAVAALLGPFSAGPAWAQSPGLTVERPWSRATPAGAKVAGGFVTVRNAGPEADRLLGGSSEIASRVQVHETTMADGVARMREVAQGVEIRPGATIELKPGGYHLMFEDLKRPLKQGERFTATLRFERAGERPVEFTVEGIGARGAASGASRGHHH
jgi:periplasmic copper chaperone A